jgi:hypothetical protein
MLILPSAGYAARCFRDKDVIFEVNASSSQLLYKLGDSDMLIGHEVKVAEFNHIEGILPFSLVERNGSRYCYYDITSLLSLAFFLRRRKLERNELVRLLSDISWRLMDCGGYLLDDSGYVLNSDYMFIDPETLKISMIYIPACIPSEGFGKESTDSINRTDSIIRRGDDCTPVIPATAIAFREFVLDLMLKRISFSEDDNDDFYQKIVVYIRDDNYSIKGFYDMLRKLMQTGKSIMVSTSFKELELAPEKIESGAGQAGGLFGWLPGKKILKSKSIGKNELKSISGDKEDFSSKAGSRGVTQTKKARTELLIPSKPGVTVLSSANRLEYEDIPIDKDEVLIGRLEGQVDHICTNPAIGKVHAQITKRGEDAYFIKDLNSVNGTFINCLRIVCNTDYRIREGDQINLANNEYIFRINPCHSVLS